MPIELGSNALTTSGLAPTIKKPPYLITLENGVSGKNHLYQRFISLDKPEAINGFIQVKGIFTDCSEDEIIKAFSDILTTTPKESILEMMFPLHRVYSIRNLVFNAVKTVTTPNRESK